jgi:chromosome partitioning protein
VALPMPEPFLTIGHSIRPIAEFIDLLRHADVRLVVDVRTIPRSLRNPQFNLGALAKSLACHQIGYERIVVLGGLRGKSRGVPPEVNAFWSNESFHNYADYAMAEPFQHGIALLREPQRCAIMCAEALWWRCHRRIIDTDPQGTLTAWHSKREAETPARVDLPFEGLEKGLELIHSHGAAYCIIDTASGRLDIAMNLFKLADLVIFPVQPSEDDLTAAPVTVQNLKQTGVPFVFALTRVKPNTLITAQAAAILSKHGQVSETFVAERTSYKSPYAKGQTITEAEPKGLAAQEISALWQNIKACLHESTPQP